MTYRTRPTGAPCVKTRRRLLGLQNPPENYGNHKAQGLKGIGGRSHALLHYPRPTIEAMEALRLRSDPCPIPP